MTDSPRPVRPAPQRPPKPNSKGLTNAVRVPVDFEKVTAQALSDRATYETIKWRTEHNGKGRAITSQDIIRRAVDAYFRRELPIPPDGIGLFLRRRVK